MTESIDDKKNPPENTTKSSEKPSKDSTVSTNADRDGDGVDF